MRWYESERQSKDRSVHLEYSFILCDLFKISRYSHSEEPRYDISSFSYPFWSVMKSRLGTVRTEHLTIICNFIQWLDSMIFCSCFWSICWESLGKQAMNNYWKLMQVFRMKCSGMQHYVFINRKWFQKLF